CASTSGGVLTSANVSVSNGRTYVLETYYADAEHAAVRQTRPTGEVETSVIAGEQTTPADGGLMLRTIVLGHQVHALLLHFDTIPANVRDGEAEFGGARRATRDGDWPYGGVVQLVQAANGGHPEGFVFHPAGAPEIRIAFSDWRGELPFHMVI